MDVTFDFSDVDHFFQEGKEEIKSIEKEVGAEAVQHAIGHGNYQDRTGRLRKSNSYEVDDEGLGLKNDAEYASFVESKGFDVLSDAVLEAEKRLKERIG
jgi:hypothetical protein